MNLIRKLLIGDIPLTKADSNAQVPEHIDITDRRAVEYRREIAMPYVAGHNFMQLFLTVPEVFFPIDFIASRISKAHFEIKRMKDDSVVWCNRRMSRILANPNCLMGWQDIVYEHFVYKLTTGNAFLRAAMSDAFADGLKYKMCDHYWALPSNYVTINPARQACLYGICDKNDLISDYSLEITGGIVDIPTWQVWHDRDGVVSTDFGPSYLKATSRLMAAIKPISNLIAVYEARNVIYVKRGGLGFLVSQKRDAAGTAAMTPNEKRQVSEHLTKEYGLGAKQSPIGVSDVPMTFIRTNLSIQELQPFEETLEDAVKIASVFGIPRELVPSKDHSTYSNLTGAEKSYYTGVIIPMAKQFCDGLTTFLGLDKDGLYIDCDFSDVDCLQVGLKDAEEVKKMVNDRCKMQFDNGLITLNDWRAQIHESQIEEGDDPLFSKLKFQMDEQELARVTKIQRGYSAPIENNNQTSTEE